jgi:non-homologous end joining protein Ku
LTPSGRCRPSQENSEAHAAGKGRRASAPRPLRCPYELRKQEDYFDDLPDEQMPEEMVELAVHIVTIKARHFQLEEFADHYERALNELIKKKQRDEKLEKPRQQPLAKVINLMMRCVEARQSAVARPGQIVRIPQRASGHSESSRVRGHGPQAERAV